jgi:hypothetical protein
VSISFQLPELIEKHLRAEVGDIDVAAKEAALIELYRQEKLTHHQLATALGLDRFQTDALLKRHHVTEDLITPAEFSEQLAGLRRLLGE